MIKGDAADFRPVADGLYRDLLEGLLGHQGHQGQPQAAAGAFDAFVLSHIQNPHFVIIIYTCFDSVLASWKKNTI